MILPRFAAAALADFGAASAVPLALAQLDFAGFINAFDIDAGDTPTSVLVLASIGSLLTCCVLATAFLGAALAFGGVRGASGLLGAAAIAGFATALVFWIPAGLMIGSAAVLLHRAERDGSTSAALI